MCIVGQQRMLINKLMRLQRGFRVHFSGLGFLAAGRLNVWLLILLAAVGCSGAASADLGAAAPILAQSPQSPAEVVEGFLEAWNAQDYPAMYALVSPESQELYAFAVFQTTYENADGSLAFSGVTYTIHDTTIQGMTAAVNYDVTLTSSAFETIEDPGRTMRLIHKPEGWRVAWSSMDIFDALAAGSQIQVFARRDPRGDIYDRDGSLLVEEGGTVYALYVARQNMSSENDCINLLAHALVRPRFELVQLFSNYNPETIFLVGDIDPEIYNAEQDDLLATCSVTYLERETRRYFGHGAALHVTGYIGQTPADQLDRWVSLGYQPGDLVGLMAVENAYDAVLGGRADRVLRIVEPGGAVLRELAGTEGSPPQPVTLTIDRDLQYAAAQAVTDAYSYAEPNWGGRSAGAAAVVLDVNTGAILALVSYPFFDPGIFNPDTYYLNPGEIIAGVNTDDRRPFTNRVTQQQYAPGSVFKIFTTAAAASEALIAPDDIFHCGLEWERGPEFGDTLPIRPDWRKTDGLEATGDITITQALTASCDPFYYEMGARLFRERGANVLVEYARRMGLGAPVGLEPVLPEAPGNLAPPSSVEEAINNAIGQGNVQIPPIQMAAAVAAVANGGTLYQPYLVQQVGGRDDSEPSFEAAPIVVRETGLSDEVIQIIHDGMCQVTVDTDLGTAWGAFENTNYWACGKTGTAQTARIEPHAWFVAFAPKDDPEIAVVVMVENSREGSEVAAPIARRIIDAYLGEPYNNYPPWWQDPYKELNIPVGGTGGG
jgi:penicillin-binding protein 2